MQKIYYIFLSLITILTIFITVFSVENSNYVFNYESEKYYWPTPNFYGISSYFGYREKPTNGATSFHKGIDILANQGSSVSTVDDGIIQFAGWDNSGGYMITILHANNVKSSYAHLDPKLYVKKGDMVKKGDVIGMVGPKYVENGKLNGATTGVHLHLGISISGNYINPLELFLKKYGVNPYGNKKEEAKNKQKQA